MSLLLLLRSQVAAQATLVRGGSTQATYTVTVHYDQTSGAVTSLSWVNTGGALTVSIRSGGQPPFTQTDVTGTGSAAPPAGLFFDQGFSADTKWSAG